MSEGDGDDDDPLDRKQRKVYQRDLYQEHYSLTVRIPSELLEDGDLLDVTVTKTGEVVAEDRGETTEHDDTSTGN